MALGRRPLLLSALLSPAVASAQPVARWQPDRPIRAVVPFAPGGLADLLARLTAGPAGTLLGQSVVVENRTGGAAGLVGTDAVAKALPDGYTMLINSSAQAIAPALVARMPYDTVGDFAGVAILGSAPMVLVCHPGVPAQNLGELLALLRRDPARYNFSASGIGSAVHLTGEVFRAAAGLELQFVQYRGGGPSLQATVSGEAQLTATSAAEAIGFVRSGAVRALAVSAPARSPVLPEVPTSTEAGLPAFQQDIWIVALAPARTPPNVVAALNAAFNTAVRQNEARLVELGLYIRADVVTPDQVLAFVRGERDRYAALLRAAGVQPE